MTKRASGKFKRHPRDSYATPHEAVVPLLPHLARTTQYDEPCCGGSVLIHHLKLNGHYCVHASDIIEGRDALDITECYGDVFITNPPWTRPILHRLIVHLSDIAPTWLLIDADWMHTKQSILYMERCVKIVSVGRVSWFGKTVGFDNCAWYLFDGSDVGFTQFIGRAA